MSEVERNVTKQVSGAALWSYAGTFADRAIGFGVFVIVARLVGPSDFGLAVLSLLIVDALQVVLDTGLSTALNSAERVVEVTAGHRISHNDGRGYAHVGRTFLWR